MPRAATSTARSSSPTSESPEAAGDRDFTEIRDLTAVSAPASVQSLRERPDPGDEPVEEHERVDLDTDKRVGFSAPVTTPVGDRHAAGQGAGQLDIDRGGPVLHQIWIHCDGGGP